MTWSSTTLSLFLPRYINHICERVTYLKGRLLLPELVFNVQIYNKIHNMFNISPHKTVNPIIWFEIVTVKIVRLDNLQQHCRFILIFTTTLPSYYKESINTPLSWPFGRLISSRNIWIRHRWRACFPMAYLPFFCYKY